MDQNKCIKTLMGQAQKLFKHCRQGSYKTRERYFAAFKRFLAFLATTYRLQKIANISGKHLSAYVRHMQGKNLSAATIKTDISGIKFRHDQIPQAKYKLPDNSEWELERRSYRGHGRTWTDEEFAHMLSAAEEQQRDDYAAAMVLSRYMGLRIHEVFRTDTASARAAIKNDYLTIKGKGGKVRDIPNHPEADAVLIRLLERTPPGQKLLLPPDKKTHLAIKELQQFIADYRPPRLGKPCEREITFHGLRHMFAAETYQRLRDQGASDEMAKLRVSRWLGHEREDVTEIYLASIRNKDKS